LAPSAVADASRRKLSAQLPPALGGGFTWGGRIMHSPDEAYSYAHSHGSGLNRQQFFSRYSHLGQMEHPAAESGLEASAGHMGQPTPAHPELDIGTLLAGVNGAQPNLHSGSLIDQALLAAHVVHALRGLAAQYAA
jgi:hypothetical protein